jgi:hypothetical protein
MKKPKLELARDINTDSLRLAYSLAKKSLAKNSLIASSCSAGTVLPAGERGTREGFQVFVKVAKFSEKLLKEQPLTGGLLCEIPDQKNLAAKLNAQNAFDDLVSSLAPKGHKWTPVQRFQFNRISRYLKKASL